MHKNVSYLNDKIKYPIALNIGVKFADLVEAIKKLSSKDREEFLENLLAATSPEYLNSIREAREDYRKGCIYSHAEAFGNKKSKK